MKRMVNTTTNEIGGPALIHQTDPFGDEKLFVVRREGDSIRFYGTLDIENEYSEFVLSVDNLKRLIEVAREV